MQPESASQKPVPESIAGSDSVTPHYMRARWQECLLAADKACEISEFKLAKKILISMRDLEKPLVEKRKRLTDLLMLGASHEREQNFDEGTAVYIEALAYAQEFLPPNDPTLNSLEKACANMQKNLQAMNLSLQPRSIDLGLRSVNIDGKKLMAVQQGVEQGTDLAEQNILNGNYTAAAQHYEDAVKLLNEAPLPNRDKMKSCLNRLLDIYVYVGDADKVLSTLEEKNGTDPLQIHSAQAIKVLVGVAKVYAKTKRYQDACAVYLRAMQMANAIVLVDKRVEAAADELSDAYIELRKTIQVTGAVQSPTPLPPTEEATAASASCTATDAGTSPASGAADNAVDRTAENAPADADAEESEEAEPENDLLEPDPVLHKVTLISFSVLTALIFGCATGFLFYLFGGKDKGKDKDNV